MNKGRSHAILVAACLLQLSAACLCGQTNQIIYANSLQNGWVDESWATDNLADTNFVLPGFSNSISVFCTEYAALALAQTPSSSAYYSSLTFWLNGGETGGQVLTVAGTLDGSYQTLLTLPPLASNTWKEFTIPLSAIGVADQTDFDGIWIWNDTASTIPTFYVGDIFLVAGSPPPPPPPPPPPNTYIIYSNGLVNGWFDGSYNVNISYTNTTTVYPGRTDSISVTVTAAYGGIQLFHAGMADTNYASITFWLNGGPIGGQQLQMYAWEGNTLLSPRYSLGTPVAGLWVQYTVPLSALGVANVTDFTGFAIQDSAGGSEPTFYLDDIGLASATAPSVTLLSINANQHVRTADPRWFAINGTMWDSYFDTSQTLMLLTNMGIRAIRLPGGSLSDTYNWVENESVGNNWQWMTSFANFIDIVTNIEAETMITVNYGTGTPQEAAAWVAYCNAATNSTVSLGTDQYRTNWHTAGFWASLRAQAPLATDDGMNFLRLNRPAPMGCKYWEIGNEIYGTWEEDSNTNTPFQAHDPWTYAQRFESYYNLMRAVDSTIKIGAVASPGATAYANYTNHWAVDPVTGVTNYGWTPVMLAYLKTFHATPDFLIYHNYPQCDAVSDAGLLACTTSWAPTAANLRQMITDYMGAATGSNIELVCTEYNNDACIDNKQTVSLVNGLYKLDSLAQVMQTEFNGLFWWDLRNGVATDGDMSSDLYGWRMYSDQGVVYPDAVLAGSDPYPTYYTTVLMTHFAQAGDTILSSSSDWPLLTTYGALRQNGSLTVLTINKDPVNTLTGQVSVAGFTPAPGGAVYSYGIPQDDAAETGAGSPDVAQTGLYITGTNFTYAFPPYSATVMVLSPPPASDYFIYTTNADNSLTLTGYTGYGGAVTIPTNINNLVVTGIGNGQNPVFSASLNTVTIPGTVQSIAANAFSGCTSLTSVEFGANVTSIGESAFFQCISLANVTIPASVTNLGSQAFQDCSSLTGVYFQGNAPGADSTVFANDRNATAYYLSGTTGWGATIGGIPTAAPFLPNPVILSNGRGFGVQGNMFGFTISWATNASVVVEACTNLASPVWVPLQTNSLTNGSFYFSEPLQTNVFGRYYRVVSP